MFPSSSHDLPIRNHPPKADLRRPITAWKALVWAYRDECVRVATNKACGSHAMGNGAVLQRVGESGLMDEPTIGGYLEAHEDAVAIDAWLLKVALAGDYNTYALIAKAAEAARPLAPVAAIERRRLVPVLRENGKPEIRYSATGRRVASYCLLMQTGMSEAECQAVQRHQAALFALFVVVLDQMDALVLSRWAIAGRGL